MDRTGTIYYDDGERVTRKSGYIRELDGHNVSILIGDTLVTIPMCRVIRIEEDLP